MDTNTQGINMGFPQSCDGCYEFIDGKIKLCQWLFSSDYEGMIWCELYEQKVDPNARICKGHRWYLGEPDIDSAAGVPENPVMWEAMVKAAKENGAML